MLYIPIGVTKRDCRKRWGGEGNCYPVPGREPIPSVSISPEPEEIL